MCVNTKVVTQLCLEYDLNPRPVDRKFNAPSVVPPRSMYIKHKFAMQTSCRCGVLLHPP